MSKRATWKKEIPTLLGAIYGVYFGFSGGAYAGPPGAWATIHYVFSAGLGLASVALIITTITLMKAMRAHDKMRCKVERYRAMLAEREAESRAPS